MITWNQDVDAYIAELPPLRRAAVSHLREVIINNLPEPFQESFDGMPVYVVDANVISTAHQPDGDESVSAGTSSLPCLSFINKENCVSLYHVGLDRDIDLQRWIEEHCRARLTPLPEIENNWIHFREPQNIPFELVANLIRLHSVPDWFGEPALRVGSNSEGSDRSATN